MYNNGRHVRPTGFIKDMDKYNEAAVMGWILLRVEPKRLLTTYTMEKIAQAIETRNKL